MFNEVHLLLASTSYFSHLHRSRYYRTSVGAFTRSAASAALLEINVRDQLKVKVPVIVTPRWMRGFWPITP